MATSVTFICLKYPYQKLQVFDGIFSKGGARKNRHKPHNVAAPPRREQSPASKEENKNGLTEGAKTFCSTQQSNVITVFRDTKYDKSRSSPSLTSDDKASDCLLIKFVVFPAIGKNPWDKKKDVTSSQRENELTIINKPQLLTDRRVNWHYTRISR